MTDIAELGIKIKADDIREAVAELDRLEKQSEKTEKSTSSLAGSFAKGAGAIAAAASSAAVAMFALAKNAASYQDEMAHSASIAGVSVKRFSELAHWAAQNNGNTQQLSDALKFLNKNLAEASNGAVEQSVAFNRLGVSITDANGNIRDAGNVFESVADGLNKIESSAEKTRLSMLLMGRAGSEMSAVMAGGSENIKAMASDAAKLGIVLDQEASERADAFGDSIDRSKSAIRGLSIAIANEAIPTLTNLTNKFADFISGLSGGFDPAADALRKFNDLIKPNIELLNQFGIETKIIRPDNIYEVSNALEKAAAAGLDLKKESALSAISAEIKTTSGRMALLSQAIERIDAVTGGNEKATQNQRSAYSALNLTLEELVKKYQAISMGEEKLSSSAKGSESIIGVWTAAEDAVRSAYSEIDKLNDAVIIQDWLFRQGAISAETYSKNIESVLNASGAADSPVVTKDTSAMDAAQAQASERLEWLRDSMMTETEAIRAAEEEKLFIIEEAFQRGLATEQEWADKRVAINEEAEAKIKAVQQATQQARMSLASNFLGSLAELAQAGGKKTFKLFKGLAIAETAISTYSAAQKAFESQIIPGDPTSPARGAVAAAAAIAAGIARVTRIKGMEIGSSGGGGGGGGGAPGGSGNGGGYSAPPLQPARKEQQSPMIQIINNGIMSQENVQMIGDLLKKAAGADYINIEVAGVRARVY